jgi:gamma-glutamyltranspeptidase/glutathione hydrolase
MSRILIRNLTLSAILTALALRACGQTAGEPVRADHGMVVSAQAIASHVGADILKRGGNAVDAAVATGLALAVVYPAAGNLGGGGFMLVRMADGRAVAVDYRETAPAKASRDMYLDSRGEIVPLASLLGYRASGVPGTVAGFALALEKYGTMKWADVVEPARKLAAEGFPVSRSLAGAIRGSRELAAFPESRRVFQRDGRFYAEGETLRQPELAATLARLQSKGPREFYEGETARMLAEEMQRGGGLITAADLKGYKASLREPIRGTYRGYEVITMPPPSSGGIALVEMLNMLEAHDLGKLGFGSSAYVHLLIEVMRRAFADRAEFLGDPDFVRVPGRGLIDKRYATARAKDIDTNHASSSGSVSHGNPAPHESTQTTHFSVVDAQGNAVSNTYTLNTGFGSGVTVKGAGFLLNNEMDDFTSKPGTPNGFGLLQSESNTIAPRKRPLSSMTPTILLRDGKLFLVLGSPGGPTIINSVLEVILNVVDHGMNVRQTVEAPRFHHQWMPDVVTYEPFGLSPDAVAALTAMGHKLEKTSRYQGDVAAIQIEARTGKRLGDSDPRSPDAAAIGH